MAQERPPTGLKAPGKRLWVEVAEAYELDPDDLVILGKVCRLIDRVARWERLEAELDDPIVTGSAGQPMMHPLANAIRQDYLAIGRLFDQLRLPDVDEVIGRNVASKQAQKAARARWGGRGRKTS
jgi:hypothetical protein